MNHFRRIMSAISGRQNEAQQIHEALGMHTPQYPTAVYRGATAERMTRGPKAGAYARGLTNWRNRKPSHGRV